MDNLPMIAIAVGLPIGLWYLLFKDQVTKTFEKIRLEKEVKEDLERKCEWFALKQDIPRSLMCGLNKVGKISRIALIYWNAEIGKLRKSRNTDKEKFDKEKELTEAQRKAERTHYLIEVSKPFMFFFD